MTTGAVSGINQQSITYHYTDHSDDYIPKTSEWGTGMSCEFVSPSKTEARQRCCSTVKTIDKAIDKAYSNGVQSHLGIKAIQDYPCVTEHEMGKLSNDLNKKIKQYKIETPLPDGLDPIKKLRGDKKETRKFCKEVVFEKLARDLGRVSDSKPIAFTKHVFNYCLRMSVLPPSELDISGYGD